MKKKSVNFITINSYQCVELNSHGLITIIMNCKNNEKTNSNITIFSVRIVKVCIVILDQWLVLAKQLLIFQSKNCPP